MVLVDFTLAERWRIIGELTFATVPPRAQRPARMPPPTAVATRPARSWEPTEAPARHLAQAALMQRFL